ncbi:MAG: helix-turn-helix domain-containing protein [bacterium]
MDERMVKELIEIGLSEKEARVYLAGLELGPATAQNIAVKALVNRPTTYIMIESLTRRGLMSQVLQGKKKMFTASSPEQFLYVLKNKRLELDKRERFFSDFVEREKVKAKKVSSVEKPEIQIFEGIDGLLEYQTQILSLNKGTEVLEMTSPSRSLENLPASIVDYDIRKKIVRKLSIRSLSFVSADVLLKPNPECKERVINKEEFPFNSEIVLYDNRVAFVVYGKDLTILVVKNREIFDSIKMMFEVFWKKGTPI